MPGKEPGVPGLERRQKKVRFDKGKPGRGVEIHCRLENGKAWLIWEFWFQEELEGNCRDSCRVEVTVTDGDGRLAAYGITRLDEDEPLETLLLHPRLWNGMEDPCLYGVEAQLLDPGGSLLDRICLCLPLREITDHPGKGVMLNGKAFVPRAVRYIPPCREDLVRCNTAKALQETGKPMQGVTKALQIEQMRRDLILLKEMGANCIHYEAGSDGLYDAFLQMCDKYGFLVWRQREGIPCRAELDPAAGCLLDARNLPTPLYYRYRAKWGREPFVYVAPESVRRQQDGDFAATVYSNCHRVALYTDGQLHGFASGEEEFDFQGIPARHPCIMLSAEAEGCSMSLSLHKSYVRQADSRRSQKEEEP